MEKSKTIYIDANIFIFALCYDDENGERYRKLLKDVHEGKKIGVTSCLTVDEVWWYIKKTKSELFNEASAALLNLNIKFSEVSKSMLYKAREYMIRYNLKPRDAIHVSTMESQNIKEIMSTDEDFDKVPWIKRVV